MKNRLLIFALTLLAPTTSMLGQTTILPFSFGWVNSMQEVGAAVYVNVWDVALNQYSEPHNYVSKFTLSAELVCTKYTENFRPYNIFNVHAPDIWLCGYTPYTPYDYPITIALTEDCQSGNPHGYLGIYPQWTYVGNSLFFDPVTKKMRHFPDFTEISIPWDFPVDSFSVSYDAADSVFYAFSANTDGFQERTFSRQGDLLDDWSVTYPQIIPTNATFERNRFTGNWLVHYFVPGTETLLLVSRNPQSVKLLPPKLSTSLLLPSGYFSWSMQNSDSTIISVELSNFQGEAQWKKYYLIDTISKPDIMGAQILTSAGKIMVGVTTNMEPFLSSAGTTWHGNANLLITDENFEGFVDSLPGLSSVNSLQSQVPPYVYPNPIKAGQNLVIKNLDLFTDAIIRITNANGKLLVNEPLHMPFSMPKLPAKGIYYLQMIQAKSVFSCTLMYLE